MPIRAGKLTHTLRFERRGTARNAFNEIVDAWELITYERGSIEPLTGTEYFAAAQTQTDLSARIVCRYSAALASVSPRDRVVTSETTYDIRSVIDIDMRHQELQFMVMQHVGP